MELLQTYAFVVKVGADTGAGFDDENNVDQGSVRWETVLEGRM